jgi:hypothetical protein
MEIFSGTREHLGANKGGRHSDGEICGPENMRLEKCRENRFKVWVYVLASMGA